MFIEVIVAGEQFSEAITRATVKVNHPRRFHHGLYEVHLPVTDLNRAIDFYVGKLGFELGFTGRGQSSVLLMYTDGAVRAASVFFHDPDGHLLELIADLSDAPHPEILYRPLSEWRALVGRVAR